LLAQFYNTIRWGKQLNTSSKTTESWESIFKILALWYCLQLLVGGVNLNVHHTNMASGYASKFSFRKLFFSPPSSTHTLLSFSKHLKNSHKQNLLFVSSFTLSITCRILKFLFWFCLSVHHYSEKQLDLNLWWYFTFMWPYLVTNFFIIKPTRCTNFPNLLVHETLHVSCSSSAYHQEFIHCTLGTRICHTAL
jgi:hypothetical protein